LTTPKTFWRKSSPESTVRFARAFMLARPNWHRKIVIGRVLGMPVWRRPCLKRIGQDDGSNCPIDYFSRLSAEGRTKPSCRMGVS
jgi:hypothetical protein